MTALPPGLSASRFASALKDLERVVGHDWVFSSPEDVDLYRDAYTPFYGEPGEFMPSGAVAPASVEQVQDIVRIANRYRLPLWPISTGRNLGYGGAAPRMSGTLVLDLKRMNRVLEVNDPLAYARVEPGVSYFDFHRYLRANGHRVWLDCPDPGWGSLIGNALDHGLGHTPLRDHFDAHCGMEVVLPNGELMRTGLGALPDARGWQAHKAGFGPHVSPMFGQANYGIVTKMGFWLLPEQEEVRSHVISVPRNADLERFLDIMAHLVNSSIVDSSWQVSSPALASNDPALREAVQARVGDAEIERLAAARGLGYWSTRIRFYGPVEVNDGRWNHVRKRFGEIPGATFADGKVYRFPMDTAQVEDEADDLFAKGGLGIPSLAIFSLGGATRSLGHIFFSPIIPATAAEFRRAQQVLGDAHERLGMQRPTTATAWSWFRRSLVLLFSLRITHDPEANRKMRENYRALVKVAAENGWSEYRTAPAFMDPVMNELSFNDHALRRFHETLKDALDPNGVLAPGKSGIWPRLYRNQADRSRT